MLDVSGSMNYGSGEVKKIDYARILAACLTYFAYHQRDGVGLLTFDTEVRAHIPPSRRRGQLFKILSEIDRDSTQQANRVSQAAAFPGGISDTARASSS